MNQSETTKFRHGDDFHRVNGAKSWKDPNRSRLVGFAAHPELAAEAGRKGGLNKKGKKHGKKDPTTTQVNKNSSGTGE